jgi:hypothetical protein
MNPMSIALNKMTNSKWDPANIRPPPPESEPLQVDFTEEVDAQSEESVPAYQDAKDEEPSVEAERSAINEMACRNKRRTVRNRGQPSAISPSVTWVCLST